MTQRWCRFWKGLSNERYEQPDVVARIGLWAIQRRWPPDDRRIVDERTRRRLGYICMAGMDDPKTRDFRQCRDPSRWGYGAQLGVADSRRPCSNPHIAGTVCRDVWARSVHEGWHRQGVWKIDPHLIK